MLDISRNRVPTLEALKQLINALEALHYNELQLYTEHTFAYASHQTVWRDASPMTHEEIRLIDDYCTERGIELVPNQNSFGHMERWLRHTKYRSLAECPNGFEHPIFGWREYGSTLYPSKKSIAFIDSLYKELLPNFRSSQLHLGGDEPWDLGMGRSLKRVTEKGKHRVYIDFIKQLFIISKKYGSNPQFWADIVLEKPDLIKHVPKFVLPVIWGYDLDSPFAKQCQTLAEAGFEKNYYVAPGAGNWNSFCCRLSVAEANIRLAAKYGQAYKARGLLLTTWGDNGHHQPWLSMYPAIIIAAASAHGQILSRADLARQIDLHFFPESDVSNGAVLCALGEIDGLLPQPSGPNSFLHSAFFADNEKLEKKLRPMAQKRGLIDCQKALEAIPLKNIDDEILLAVRLYRAGLERVLRVRASEDRLSIAKDFALQWQRHCRIGGLEESLSMITKLS